MTDTPPTETPTAEQLGQAQCTDAEVAAVLGWSAEQLAAGRDAIEQARLRGRARLRLQLFAVAAQTASIAAMLAKAHLGMEANAMPNEGPGPALARIADRLARIAEAATGDAAGRAGGL